jgi:antitoxin component YwqK of YwqJK toxin-antitoxin module
MFKEMTCPICRQVIPKNGFYTFYYENGMKRQEVYYKNDIPIGLVILWRMDGTIHQKFHTENSKYHGLFEDYDELGNLKQRIFYENGVFDGLFEEYYPNEILKVRCYYKKGSIVGVYQLYYKSSMLFLECECGPLAGKINGKLEVWDEEGNMIEKYQCKNGRINIVYDDNLNVSYSRKAGVFERLEHKGSFN